MRIGAQARVLGTGILLGIAVFLGLDAPAGSTPAAQTLTIVNTEASGVKVWLPSAIVVHPGTQVTLRLQNTLDAEHGFSLDAYGIHVLVPPRGTQEVTFTARPGGTERFYCQLHPGHVGGTLIVM